MVDNCLQAIRPAAWQIPGPAHQDAHKKKLSLNFDFYQLTERPWQARSCSQFRLLLTIKQSEIQILSCGRIFGSCRQPRDFA